MTYAVHRSRLQCRETRWAVWAQHSTTAPRAWAHHGVRDKRLGWSGYIRGRHPTAHTMAAPYRSGERRRTAHTPPFLLFTTKDALAPSSLRGKLSVETSRASHSSPPVSAHRSRVRCLLCWFTSQLHRQPSAATARVPVPSLVRASASHPSFSPSSSRRARMIGDDRDVCTAGPGQRSGTAWRGGMGNSPRVTP